MWFCFFPPFSKAAQECYYYSFSSSKQSGKQSPLMDMDKKEGTMTVVLLKVPPQLLSRNKHQKNRWALSELETKQCPLLAPAAEENSCLRREIIFFFSFS